MQAEDGQTVYNVSSELSSLLSVSTKFLFLDHSRPLLTLPEV